MTTTSPARAELLALIEQKALRRGTFRLASGREASYYRDAKQVLLEARGRGRCGPPEGGGARGRVARAGA
ncbi:MAG: hypothetical protein ACKOTB_17240, partial [Planctomycetia bacterium]